jgi:hypothetical protein
MVGQGVQRAPVVADARAGGGLSIAIPFDPLTVWGDLDAYHVHGTLGGQPYRGALSRGGDGWALLLGPKWCRSPGFVPTDTVELAMGPEGPRSTSMGDDVAAAFASEPSAARFFDSMPTFYRKNAARWIEGTRRPETRAQRIAATLDLARRRKRER